ncbi:hypothetical protein [Pararhizobium sp.]|uniref:hypothetical protein n=1 Tax=Pararhizobium sp. TaxID=1977563 RepID=UPI002716B318|nr:hypothetical protein [Pararhizobium sp.]MDO9416398.1 hypothetical protein [Pararhizobium sp.]
MTKPIPNPDSDENLSGSTPGFPGRAKDGPVSPPVTDKTGKKEPEETVLDPALLPIGDPAGMA